MAPTMTIFAKRFPGIPHDPAYSAVDYVRMAHLGTENITSVLTTFERLRISNSHSLESIFIALNRRNADSVPVKLFAENLAIYFNLDVNQAASISKLFDVQEREQIGVEDIREALKKYSVKKDIKGLLSDHPLFPKWLTSRPDFHEYFRDWTIENGAPNVALVEMALKAKNRSAGDLQLIFKWIKMYRILSQVSDTRLLEVCRSIEINVVQKGFNVVTQGDHGDSFYIILKGQCEVFVNNLSVGTLHTGMSFGEKALENNAPRAATVTAVEPLVVMVLRSSEYKSLVAFARAKEDQDIVESMRSKCPLFKEVSYARLFYMVKKMVRRIYQPGEKIIKQGDAAASFVVITSGRADIYRRFCPKSRSVDKCELEKGNSQDNMGTGHERDVITLLRKARERRNVEVMVCCALAGDITGDDILRYKNSSNSYSVIAGTVMETVLINKEDILGYFKVCELNNLGTPSHIKHTNSHFFLYFHQTKLLSLDTLIRCTQKYHVSNESLVKKHYTAISKKVNMKKLREEAQGSKYGHRVNLEPLLSRSLSTQTMLYRQARRNSLIAHSNYKKLAIEAMKNPIDRKKITRRESLVSFLVASKVVDVPNPEIPNLQNLSPANIQRRKSSLLSQPVKRKMSVLLAPPLREHKMSSHAK